MTILGPDGKGKKLTLEEVSINFNDYNFIIETSSGVFDTTDYNLHQYLEIQTTLSDLYQGGAVHMLALASNSKYDGGSGNEKLQIASLESGTEKGIGIMDYTVQRIYVKSKRNFLENQLPIKRP